MKKASEHNLFILLKGTLETYFSNCKEQKKIYGCWYNISYCGSKPIQLNRCQVLGTRNIGNKEHNSTCIL